MSHKALLAMLIASPLVLTLHAAGTESYEDQMRQARQLREAGKAKKAESVYNRILQKNHRDVDALVLRGICRLRIDSMTDEALEDFNKVIILSPSYIEAYVGAATCLKRQGKKDAAVEMLDKGRTACKGRKKKLQYLADTAWQYGHAEYARGLDPEYENKMSDAEKHRAKHLELLEKARDLRLDGYTEDAEDIYLDLLEKNPQDVDAIAGLGFCKLRDSERVDEALEDFLRVIEVSPSYIDAYIGSAICYRRKGKKKKIKSVMEECRELFRDDESKSRYLATTAWREGYFPLAREIDRQYPPEKDRVLISDPRNLRLTYGHSWVESQDDWDEVRLSGSWRLRPDITIDGEYDQWWRYGRNDLSLGIGGSYRHNDDLAFDYSYEVSDDAGFLAEQRHNASVKFRIYRRLSGFGGPRFARYDGDWSERLKLGLSQYFKNFFASYSYKFGEDTKGVDVDSHSAMIGYYYELRYVITAGYTSGEETVDLLEGEEVVFRSDDVESVYIRGRYYFTETFGAALGGMREYRNSDLFRTEISASVFKSF